LLSSTSAARLIARYLNQAPGAAFALRFCGDKVAVQTIKDIESESATLKRESQTVSDAIEQAETLAREEAQREQILERQQREQAAARHAEATIALGDLNVASGGGIGGSRTG
jgi:hypothetical protein